MFQRQDFIAKQIDQIQKTVGNQKVCLAVSGGVDSAVCATLASLALKKNQLKAFTLDDGLRRKGEPEWVQDVFERIGIPVEIISVAEECLAILKGKVRGRDKRIAYSEWVGRLSGNIAFVFGASFIFFGTNALDIKETRRGEQIQHNAWQVTGVDTKAQFGFQIVEPIKELYKDEIRNLAHALGIPGEISQRMPFPGPGLAIRIKGEVTQEKVALIRQVTALVEEELLPLKPFQCLAYLFENKVRGIRQDRGMLGWVISVRSVDSRDSGQTAVPTFVPYEIEIRLTKRILAEIPEVVRVVFDKTSKPPGSIEYE